MKGIKYKDVIAMPKSELHLLLEEAQQKPDKAQELRKKAEQSYKATMERFDRLMK